MAAALKELSLQDEEAPEWSDSEQSDDAAQEMPWAEYSAGRRCDKCARCGLHEHVTRDCTEKVCGNCGRHGHLAADCPKPAACFRCGELGHWVKHCPKPSWWQPSSTLLRAPFNTETRWVLFEPPTIKEYTHFCRCCGYETSLLTKASQGMPRHKVKAGGSWCDGSGQPPLKSVLQRELPNTTIHSSQQLGTHDAILDWAAGVRDHDRIVSARTASGRYRCQCGCVGADSL